MRHFPEGHFRELAPLPAIPSTRKEQLKVSGFSTLSECNVNCLLRMIPVRTEGIP